MKRNILRNACVVTALTVSAASLAGCSGGGNAAQTTAAATTAAPAAETKAEESEKAGGEETKAEDAGAGAALEGEATSLSLANTQPDTDVESLQLYACEKTIEDATGGNFSVEVFTNSALGDTDDILEQAIQGTAVLTVTDPGRLADYIPDYGILQMPYIMEDYTKIDAITGTDMVKEWEKGFEEYGVKVLASNWYGGARHFVCNKEVNVPEDLNGLKIRTMGSDLCIQSVTAMGAVGTAMSQSEIYSGIEQKAIDGCENQSTSTYASRLYEVCSYVNKTGHFILLGVPATGTIYFDSLSEDYQKLLVDTFRENGTEYQKICAEMEIECEKQMEEEGMTIHELDNTPFKEAVEPVYDSLGYKDLREQILTEAGLK